MEERAAFNWLPADENRVVLTKVPYESVVPNSFAWYDWRVKVDSTKINVQARLEAWERGTIDSLLRVLPGGIYLTCSDWVIVKKAPTTEYDTCCAIMLSVKSIAPDINVNLRGDGTEPCSI
jgi:hypothetical protein